MSVLRRGYIEVTPTTDNFDGELQKQIARRDPGGKAGKQIGGQLNRALKRLDLDPIDVKADPRKAFAAIEATEEKLRRLSLDSATVEVKVQTERALGELTRFKKKLGDGFGDGGGGAAEEFSASFSSRLGPLLAKAPLSPAMGAAALAAAPVVGAVISAAVIGAAGVGGVIGGLTLVKDDPHVQAAGKALGEKLLGQLKGDASPFVDPVLGAIAKVEGRFALMDDRIENIFKTSSGFLNPLVDGALNGVDKILDGVDDLVTEGKPVIDAFGESFTIIGTATGKALSTISGGSDEAASAVTNLAKSVGVLIESGGYLVRGLTEIYGVASFLPGKFKELEYRVGGLVVGNQNYRQSIADVVSGTAGQVAAIKLTAEAAVAAAKANGALVASEADVKAQQTLTTRTQEDYKRSLDALAPSGGRAAMIVDGLRKATDALHGAQISATDANESYEASWDGLSESIKANGRSLNLHSAAGRSNRDALEGVASASKDMYFADINAGIGIDQATKKHNKRIDALKEEARRSGLDKAETDKLIHTYGDIPKGKTTKLVVAGVDAVVSALKDLYVFQRSLADGIPIASEIAKLKGEKGPAKKYGGYHTGGYTGDGAKYDPAGVVHRSEFVLNKDATGKLRRNRPGLLEEMNATGQVPGYAGGGLVAPVDMSLNWPFKATAGHTRIPSKAQVSAKVMPAFGAWPSSPSAQRGDSGVWRSVVALIKSTGPFSGSFGNAYRPGDPKWHGSGRAVDWMGFNQDRLASFLAARRPLELIHRTKQRDYAYTRGVNKGSFNNSLMEAHRNHVHIAMDDGGVRMLQPGMNLIPNGTGRPEPIAGPAAMAAMGGEVHIHLHNAVVTSKRQAVDMVVEAYNTAVNERKIKR